MNTPRTYGALQTVAALLKLGAIINVPVGLVAISSAVPEGHPGVILLGAVGVALTALFLWAAAELLLVLAGLGEDVSRVLMALGLLFPDRTHGDWNPRTQTHDADQASPPLPRGDRICGLCGSATPRAGQICRSCGAAS